MLFWTLKEVLFVDSGDPWNPRPATVTKVMQMLKGVHRVLKPDGIFISISFGQVVIGEQDLKSPGLQSRVNILYFTPNFIAIFLLEFYLSQPHFRRPFFDAPEFTWSLEWNTFGDGFHYFVYILKKVSPKIYF